MWGAQVYLKLPPRREHGAWGSSSYTKSGRYRIHFSVTGHTDVINLSSCSLQQNDRTSAGIYTPSAQLGFIYDRASMRPPTALK
jgi:hypothetical protein